VSLRIQSDRRRARVVQAGDHFGIAISKALFLRRLLAVVKSPQWMAPLDRHWLLIRLEISA
jgi:hypothetical protein